MGDETSETIIARFRSVGLERLDQIENLWVALMQRTAGHDAGNELLRLLHTLKGDARILGFVDVHFLCHRLEELVAHAHRVSYRVSDDLDMIAMMGMRFIAVLLRKKMGTSLGGIDLPGFARQIDEVLLEAEFASPSSREPHSLRAPAKKTALIDDRLSEAALHTLASAATDVYLEWLVVDERARRRLRSSWEALLSFIERLASVSLAERIERHQASAQHLARELEKQVDVDFQLNHVRVREEVARALDVVLLHGIGNAVDHGIETPARRREAGKTARGKIRVSARRDRGEVLLSISDDGCGIDREAIMSRAPKAANVADDALLSLLFEPGFSTRSEVGSISGRGVGLNAVRAEVNGVGGTVRLESVAGGGTTLLVRIPHRGTEMDVHVFGATGAGIDIAVPATWQLREVAGEMQAHDPFAALDIGAEVQLAKLFELRRGNHRYVMRTCGPAHACVVQRRCATSDGHPVEVVWNQSRETLLLRPEVLFVGGGTSTY